MASILHEANKTDEAIFLPSSLALRRAQRGGLQMGRAHASNTAKLSAARMAMADSDSGAEIEAESVGLDDMGFSSNDLGENGSEGEDAEY